MVTLAEIQDVTALLTRIVQYRRQHLADPRHPTMIADCLLSFIEAPDLSTAIAALQAEVDRLIATSQRETV